MAVHVLLETRFQGLEQFLALSLGQFFLLRFGGRHGLSHSLFEITRHIEYEQAHRIAVPAAQPHASTPSPIAMWAITAETSVKAKPAYAHSLSRAGAGASSNIAPSSLAHASSTRK